MNTSDLPDPGYLPMSMLAEHYVYLLIVKHSNLPKNMHIYI